MSLFFRPLIFLLGLMLLSTEMIQADPARSTNPSIYLSDDEWTAIQDYLIPDNHPMKKKLDEIFSASRVLADRESMIAAGFELPNVSRKNTKIIVARHPELPGHVIKAYLDGIIDPNGKHEQYYFMQRVNGARLIKKCIRVHRYEHLLKVPEKWIYLLPDEPSSAHEDWRRLFILVQDDMDVYGERKNQKMWRSRWVTLELLHALYIVVGELCLSDSTNPKNCPFSRDGKVALVDTEMHHTGKTKYEKMTPYLSPPMQDYWKELIRSSKK